MPWGIIELGQYWFRLAFCLMAPSHYQSQCWILINEGLWHSPEGDFIGNTQVISHSNMFQMVIIIPNDQWVKLICHLAVVPELVFMHRKFLEQGPCVTKVLRSYLKPFSQWQHNFQMKAVLPLDKRLAMDLVRQGLPLRDSRDLTNFCVLFLFN